MPNVVVAIIKYQVPYNTMAHCYPLLSLYDLTQQFTQYGKKRMKSFGTGHIHKKQVKQMVGALNSLDKSLKTDEQGAAKEEDQSEKTKRARKRANKKRNTRQRQLEEELNLPGSAEKDVHFFIFELID